MPITIDRDYIINTLADLVRINSVNPSLVPGGAGEADIASTLAYELRHIGLEVATYEPEYRRPNVVGILRGTGGGRSLMLNGHTDTVGVEGMNDPFSAEMRDGKLYGRGAFDMKGGIVACMAALKALVESGVKLRGDLIFTAVSDEEYGSIGTMAVVEQYQADGAIVVEPTGLGLVPAHKGFLWVDVTTSGRAAHGSDYHTGIDANMHMGRFLHELEKLSNDLLKRTPHPLVGAPSLHAAMIQGGSGLSNYSAGCNLKIERRTIPGETADAAMAEIQAIIDELSAADPNFKAEATCFFVRNPFEVDEQTPIVQTLSKAVETVCGEKPPMVMGVGWMDSALLAAAGIETIIFGPAGTGAHAHEEWVDIESVVTTAEVLVQAAMDYCGPA